eukprot:UN11630
MCTVGVKKAFYAWEDNNGQVVKNHLRDQAPKWSPPKITVQGPYEDSYYLCDFSSYPNSFIV